MISLHVRLRKILRWVPKYFRVREALRFHAAVEQERRALFEDSTLPLGARGERFAAIYLQERGFEILERNYVRKKYEIDLIGAKNNTVYFFEVKTRSYEYIRPGCAVTPEKKRRIYVAAEAFIRQQRSAQPSKHKFVIVEIIWPEIKKEPKSIRFLDFGSSLDSLWNPLQ